MAQKTQRDVRRAGGIAYRETLTLYELYRRGYLAQPPGKALAKLEQLLRGLPAEDEFRALLAWLGRAKIVHALEQHQLPPTSKDGMQVPDLLAIFDYGGRDVPVLIEVKNDRKPRLRLTSAAYDRLAAYGASAGLPVLVAWKIGTLWTLVPLSSFERIKTAWGCSRERALLYNLMSVLAGDFGIAFVPGVTCRVLSRREETLSSEVTKTGREEVWRLRIEDFSIARADGEKLPRLPNLLFWVLLTLGDWEERVATTTETHEIVSSYRGGMGFAQQCLALAFDAGESPLPPAKQWQKLLSEWKPRFSAEKVRNVVSKGLDLGLVHIVVDLRPKALPRFLPKLEPEPSRYRVVR